MNNQKGFTLTNLVIALIIVVILALIAIPAYRGYVKRGMATEAKALLNEINAAQQIYYSRHGKYYAGTENQQFGTSFGVDTKRNKYFTSYTLISSDTEHFMFKTNNYDGKALTIKGSLTAEPEIIDDFS